MSKQRSSTAMPLTAKSTPAERSAANRTHHQELVGHTLDNAVANGHGHAVGRNATGKMVPSDAHFQGSGDSRGKPYLAQGVLNTATRDGGAPFDDNQKVAGDYGTVDTD
jgi:hypothetical protein